MYILHMAIASILIRSVRLLDIPYSGMFPTPVSPLKEGFCEERNCKQPMTLPLTQFSVVKAKSPLYVAVLPRNNKTERIDNACYTFFELGGTLLFLFMSVVFKDGSSEQYSYVKDDIPYHLGTLRSAGPTCTFQEFAIKLSCEQTFVMYRCFLFGVCNELDAMYTPGIDSLFGLSAEPKVSDSCKEEIIEYAIAGNYSTQGYLKLPQKLPYQCVTRLGGYPCVNSHKVSENEAISKP